MIFVPKGDSVFQGCLLYQCLWKDKSGTKSSQCLSHKTCKLMRDPRRTVSHYCLRITQLVSFRDRIRTKAAKIDHFHIFIITLFGHLTPSPSKIEPEINQKNTNTGKCIFLVFQKLISAIFNVMSSNVYLCTIIDIVGDKKVVSNKIHSLERGYEFCGKQIIHVTKCG